MRRAYQFGRNSCSQGDRRQLYHSHGESRIKHDGDYSDRRRLSHNKFDSQKKSQSDNCSQFDREVERGDRDRFYGDRRSNQFNFRSRNSCNCSQSPRNRRGW